MSGLKPIKQIIAELDSDPTFKIAGIPVKADSTVPHGTIVWCKDGVPVVVMYNIGDDHEAR